MAPEDNRFDTLVADAAAHWAAGRLDTAAAAYRAALRLRPQHARVLHNLGIIAASQGEAATALDCFDAALRAEPRYEAAHHHRAVLLDATGRRDEAIAAFRHALALDPGNYAAHREVAFALLAQGRRDRALDHFARTYELRRGEDRNGMSALSLRCATRGKLLHDAAQLQYLADRRRDGQRFLALARTYAAVGGNFPRSLTDLGTTELEALGESYNTAIHIAEAPEIPEGTLAERPDRAAIVRRLEGDAAGVAYLDTLLSPRALASLRRYLLESTIWHDFSHIEGFLATYLEDGLACPLLLQIIDELRESLPELLDEHPLSQAWAFKAIEGTAAVGAHADDAVWSINFWVTPDAANVGPAGGLRVCRVPPPPDWIPQDYHEDRERAAFFLADNRGQTLTVPYAQNRAVLFRSRLVHCSDTPVFSESYPDHRINVTLLFGRQR